MFLNFLPRRGRVDELAGLGDGRGGVLHGADGFIFILTPRSLASLVSPLLSLLLVYLDETRSDPP